MSPASTDCLSSWLNCTLTGLHRVAASMIVGRLGDRLADVELTPVNAIAAPKDLGGSTPLVKNAVVATSSPTRPRITHGPRFDAVLGSIREAESAVHYTSFDQPSAHVWSEQERTGFASALGFPSARLLAHLSDRLHVPDVREHRSVRDPRVTQHLWRRSSGSILELRVS